MLTRIRSNSRLALAFGVVLASDLAGLAVMVAGGHVDAGEGILKGTPLNAPFPFVGVQVLLVATSVRAGGRARPAAAAGLVALGVVSIASGFFDGGYAAEGYNLSPTERGIQGAIVAATAAMTVAAAKQTIRGLATGSD